MQRFDDAEKNNTLKYFIRHACGQYLIDIQDRLFYGLSKNMQCLTKYSLTAGSDRLDNGEIGLFD